MRSFEEQGLWLRRALQRLLYCRRHLRLAFEAARDDLIAMGPQELPPGKPDQEPTPQQQRIETLRYAIEQFDDLLDEPEGPWNRFTDVPWEDWRDEDD